MRLILTLAALSALGEFAAMVYLPSVPAIAAGLPASLAAVQATVTVSLFAFAGFQLVVGPAADRFGRRGVLMLGLAIYAVGGAICAGAGSYEALLAGRILQAAGASAGLVVARAAAVDAFRGAALTKAFAAINVAVSAAPALAPIIGGLLQDAFGWRASFVVATAFGVAVLPLSWVSLPGAAARGRSPSILRTYGAILRRPGFLAYAGGSAAALGALFASLVGVAPTAIDLLGVSPAVFGFFPLVAILGFGVGAVAVQRLTERMAPAALFRMGLGVCALGAAALMAAPHLGLLNVAGLLGSMIVFSAGLGIAVPVGSAEALRGMEDQAGAASGFLGFLQLLGAGAGSALTAAIPMAPHLAFPIAMAAMILAAFALSLWAPKPGAASVSASA